MDLLTAIFSGLVFINTLGAIITVFREPREISATWAWLLVLVFFPFLGFIIYFFFGRKISKDRIFDLKSQDTLGIRKLAETQLEELEQDNTFFEDLYLKELAVLFLESDESVITKGNQVEIMTSGQEKFTQLKEDLRNATDHIHIGYYIFNDDELGHELLEILIEKAQQGVEVLVLYDALGARFTKQKFWKKLHDAGGRSEAFFGYTFGIINLRMNYRNHRKIVVIDGKIGYVGGFNIGDEYLGKGKLGHWRDTHLRIRGNAVLSLQARFFIDWNATVSERYQKTFSERYFPTLECLGDTAMQIVSTGPDNDYQKIKMGFVKMIYMAKKSIDIQTPYFIPDESVIEALQVAALSGVKVRIMVPCKPDHPFVYRATEYYCRNLLKDGVEIYLYEEGFLHAKTMVVDGVASTVGTSNFDMRSFRLNFEINAFIYDEEISCKLQEIFEKDIEKCLLVDEAYFKKQSAWKKLKQKFSRLLSPIL